MPLESRAAIHRNNRIRKTPLVFQHTAMKEAGFKNRESAPIVQALKSLGADRITPGGHRSGGSGARPQFWLAHPAE